MSLGYISIKCRAFHVISLDLISIFNSSYKLWLTSSLRLLFIIFTRVDAASVCLIYKSLYLPLVTFIGFVLFSVTLIKMDPCESNCHMIRLLFGSCLSEINQYIPFWHYGILLPKHKDTSLSSLLNISLDVNLNSNHNLPQNQNLNLKDNLNLHQNLNQQQRPVDITYVWFRCTMYGSSIDLRVIKSPDLSFHICLRLSQYTFDDTTGNVTLSIIIIIWCSSLH